MEKTKPFEFLDNWLQEEKNLGAPNPQQAILATATVAAIPHSRVVAIREISEEGLLFFTQKGTRKVAELAVNPNASMTFWFELKQREVVIEGEVEALSSAENEQYWKTYPKEAQARFLAYAPTSAQPIDSKQPLENIRLSILSNPNEDLSLSPHYCGFRLKPIRFMFYAYRLDELSDVIEFNWRANEWHAQLLSP